MSCPIRMLLQLDISQGKNSSGVAGKSGAPPLPSLRENGPLLPNLKFFSVKMAFINKRASPCKMGSPAAGTLEHAPPRLWLLRGSYASGRQ